MNLLTLAETVAELAKVAANHMDLTGHPQSADRLRNIQHELEREVGLVEAREMAG